MDLRRFGFLYLLSVSVVLLQSSTLVSALTIGEIQGNSFLSPYDGQVIATVQGISTHIDTSDPTNQGLTVFYMQSEQSDNDIRTSEGIRVCTDFFNADQLTLGCRMKLSNCKVEEYREKTNALTTTTLFCLSTQTPLPSVEIEECRLKVPDSITIGVNGRPVPQPYIRFPTDNPSINVESLPYLEPDLYALDFFESLEGMFVLVENPIVVAPINSYLEFVVVPDLGKDSANINARSAIVLSTGNGTGWSPERIRVRISDQSPYITMNNKDTFDGPLLGPLDYRFSHYTLLARDPLPVLIPSTLPREAAPNLGSSYLRVASYNVLNLNPTCGARCFALAQHITESLGSPDIVALQEIQDNDGPVQSDVVDCGLTMKTLIDAIKAVDQSGADYKYTQISPEYNKDGGQPNANIRQVLMYRADRVQLASAPAGDATTPVAIEKENVGNGTFIPHLSLNPGRIEPQDSAFSSSRKPLAVEFKFRGEAVFVVNVHFSSRSGDTGLFEKYQPPRLNSEPERLEQTKIVRDFVQDLLAVNNNTHVVVIGDCNEFEFHEPLVVLKQNLTLLTDSVSKDNK
eukprot:TRINITY_DN4405_c0_g1_i1.p1 TRINITY_DN4405_c0_g1~~TRINITY_DN4405_c0_g1_i1.p1  ORF type:complete len:572 (-),score=122.09 TRINITY_DN4405_c0_g1_i1:289-2004(-)